MRPMKKLVSHHLVQVLCDISESETMSAFLREILTPAELRALGFRWEICRLLLKGLPQREIARKLRVSLCNITRGSKELHKKNSIIRTILEQEARPDAGNLGIHKWSNT